MMENLINSSWSYLQSLIVCPVLYFSLISTRDYVKKKVDKLLK